MTKLDIIGACVTHDSERTLALKYAARRAGITLEHAETIFEDAKLPDAADAFDVIEAVICAIWPEWL
jgi:hypothetical protein